LRDDLISSLRTFLMVSCRFIFNKYYGVEKRAGISSNEVRPVPEGDH